MVGATRWYKKMLKYLYANCRPSGAIGVAAFKGGWQLSNLDFGSAQTGDIKAGDIAGNDINQVITHVYNVTTSLEQVTKMLSEDMQQIESRLSTLEVVERQHTSERASLTRALMGLSVESTTVTDLQKLLERQMSADADERTQRRRHLDNMLLLVIVLNIVNILIHIYRVFHRSGRTDGVAIP